MERWVKEMIPLEKAAEELNRRFGSQVDVSYVPGKTAFRNSLCERLGLSAAEAERVCDSLEQAKLIRFERSPVFGPRWTIVAHARVP
jgi:hypothetical protein